MAKEISADDMARWAFLLTLAGVVLYVLAVAVFVLGGEVEDEPGRAPTGFHG